MESNDKLTEISTKNRTCYYFNDIIKFENFGLNNALIDKNHTKIFRFLAFHTKL